MLAFRIVHRHTACQQPFRPSDSVGSLRLQFAYTDGYRIAMSDRPVPIPLVCPACHQPFWLADQPLIWCDDPAFLEYVGLQALRLCAGVDLDPTIRSRDVCRLPVATMLTLADCRQMLAAGCDSLLEETFLRGQIWQMGNHVRRDIDPPPGILAPVPHPRIAGRRRLLTVPGRALGRPPPASNAPPPLDEDERRNLLALLALDDRASILERAWLREIMAATGDRSSARLARATWEQLLRRAEMMRELGNFAAAQRLLASLPTDVPTAGAWLQRMAAAIRLLARHDYPYVVLLDRHTDVRANTPPRS